MTNWKAKLASIGVSGLSTTALVVCILGGIALAGECNGFRGKSKAAVEPMVAAPTKVEEKAPAIVLPCRDVQAIDPKPAVREKLAEKYHRPDLAPPSPELARQFENGITAPVRAEILGERELPPTPNGGTALVTLEPGGRVEVTVVPKPERLFEWKSTYEAGALYGVGQGGDTRGRGWVAVEPLRFARLHLRIEGGVDLRAGTAGGYALAGVVWRSR